MVGSSLTVSKVIVEEKKILIIGCGAGGGLLLKRRRKKIPMTNDRWLVMMCMLRHFDFYLTQVQRTFTTRHNISKVSLIEAFNDP